MGSWSYKEKSGTGPEDEAIRKGCDSRDRRNDVGLARDGRCGVWRRLSLDASPQMAQRRVETVYDFMWSGRFPANRV